jgi:hypothetical protein
MEHLEGIGKTLSGLGMDPTAAQLQAIKSFNLPAPMEQHYIQQLALRDIVSRGLGGQTFGKDYDSAAKAVDTRLKADPTWGTMSATKPLEAHKMRDQYIADALHDAYTRSGTDDWQRKLAQTASPYLMPHLIGGATTAPPVGP